MWLMNSRLLQFCSNLTDTTQVKDLVKRAKDISAGIRNNNECERFRSGRGNYCLLSSCPELSGEQRAHTPVRTLTHVWNETTGFADKQTHVQTRPVSHAGFALLGRMGTSSSNSSPADRDSMNIATECFFCFIYAGEQRRKHGSGFSCLDDCIVLWSAFEDY